MSPGNEEQKVEELEALKSTKYPTPEELAEYRKKRPEQFAFTEEWKKLVQARATSEMLIDTGLLH